MDVEPKYTFVSLADTDNCQVNDKNTRELFKKWGMNLSCQKFLFNETFHLYHKYNLAEAFFKDSNVTEKLKIWCGNEFRESNLTADEVEIKQIPCSIMSMTFFDKLKNLDNNIIHATGNIRQKFDDFVDGILVSDNLRAMLLDEESNEYNLYTPDERNEFIFKLFQLLVIGGEYCQYENDLENYLDLTKSLYKDFVRIQKQENKLFITTIVLEVIAKKMTCRTFHISQNINKTLDFFNRPYKSRNKNNSSSIWKLILEKNTENYCFYYKFLYYLKKCALQSRNLVTAHTLLNYVTIKFTFNYLTINKYIY